MTPVPTPMHHIMHGLMLLVYNALKQVECVAVSYMYM